MTEETRLLLVADSFRVRLNPHDGAAEVRGWSEHLARFRTGVESVCAETQCAPSPNLETFLTDARDRIQQYGEGFPRLELWSRGDLPPALALNLRPLPPLGAELSMRTAPGVVLSNAAHKGPNIARLGALNQHLGAEALLTDFEGTVLEGATTSLVWWDTTNHNGHVVADRRNRVASVTERLVSREVELTGSRITPTELSHYEVWAVNALHGIRVVTSIEGVATRKANAMRLRWVRQKLDQYWSPVLTLATDSDIVQ